MSTAIEISLRKEGLPKERLAEYFIRTWRDKVGLFVIVVGSAGILDAVDNCAKSP